MKCLSLHQPWATLLVRGFIEYDIRSWRTAHRGPLAIHASLKLSESALGLCRRPAISALLEQMGYALAFDLPRGGVVGAVQLIDVVDRESPAKPALSDAPLAWDDRTGKFLWKMAQARALPEPILVRTLQGVFEIPDVVMPGFGAYDVLTDQEPPCTLGSFDEMLTPRIHTV
jgi:hypothetical protein